MKKTIVCAMALFAVTTIPSFADPVSSDFCGEEQTVSNEAVADDGSQRLPSSAQRQRGLGIREFRIKN